MKMNRVSCDGCPRGLDICTVCLCCLFESGLCGQIILYHSPERQNTQSSPQMHTHLHLQAVLNIQQSENADNACMYVCDCVCPPPGEKEGSSKRHTIHN